MHLVSYVWPGVVLYLGCMFHTLSAARVKGITERRRKRPPLGVAGGPLISVAYQFLPFSLISHVGCHLFFRPPTYSYLTTFFIRSPSSDPPREATMV